MSNYGLKVFDTKGNSSLVIPKLAQIISNGTVTMPDSLNGDGTYGVDIDLPGDEDISNGDLGMIVQVRDFNWRAIINNFTYDTNKYWKAFYGDDDYTYYEKDSITQIMTPWTPGDLSGGDILEWDPLIQISPLAGWDKNGSTSKAMRIYAAMHYGFLHPYAGDTDTTTLYGQYSQHTINTILGYKLLESQGSTLQTSGVTSDYGARWFNSLAVDSNVFIVHQDGSTTQIGNGIATYNKSDPLGSGSEQGTGTWSCPETSLEPTDAIAIRVDVIGNFWYNDLFPNQKSFSVTFISSQLGWSKLNAATWTFYYYLTWASQVSTYYSTVTLSWGDSSKEFKITGMSYKPLMTIGKSVATIGSNGVSEVDYIIYMKNYKGN